MEFKMSPLYSSLFLFFICILFSSLSAQKTGPTDIVVNNPVRLTSDNVFRMNMVSNVTCSADQINLDPSILKIEYLKLCRQLLGSTTVDEIVILSPYSAFGDFRTKNIPIGRLWTVDFSGIIPKSDILSVNYDTRSTKAELTMNDVRCADAGVYECVVGYRTPSGSFTLSGQQNIPRQSAIKNFYVSLDPQNVDFQYTAGVLVTITCYAEGPEDIQLLWYYSEPNSSEVLRPFVDSNIHMKPKPNDECGSMKHRNMFSILLQEAQDGYMYVCTLKDGNDTKLQQTFTLSISPAESNIVAFVFIGCSVVLVLIAIVTYIVVSKKRDNNVHIHGSERENDVDIHGSERENDVDIHAENSPQSAKSGSFV